MKSFTSGFESIFGVSAEEIELGIAEDQVEVLSLEKEPIATEAEAPQRRKKYSRRVSSIASNESKSTSKNFTSDLESLFRDALTETFEEPLLKEALEEPARQTKENITTERERSPRKKRRISTPGGSGLDLLIRQTTDETILEYESPTKRVSFVFDKEKLAKLKRIARERNLFLKDVVGEVVTKFINEYESTYGKIPQEGGFNLNEH